MARPPKDTEEPFEKPEPLDTSKMSKEEQIELSSRLQDLLLRTYERRLINGTISDTGLAALQRLLDANGWSLDPSRIPQGLKDKLTSKVKPEDLDDVDLDVIPFKRRA